LSESLLSPLTLRILVYALSTSPALLYLLFFMSKLVFKRVHRENSSSLGFVYEQQADVSPVHSANGLVLESRFPPALQLIPASFMIFSYFLMALGVAPPVIFLQVLLVLFFAIRVSLLFVLIRCAIFSIKESLHGFVYFKLGCLALSTYLQSASNGKNPYCRVVFALFFCCSFWYSL
jgi:hypothetical protein